MVAVDSVYDPALAPTTVGPCAMGTTGDCACGCVANVAHFRSAPPPSPARRRGPRAAARGGAGLHAPPGWGVGESPPRAARRECVRAEPAPAGWRDPPPSARRGAPTRTQVITQSPRRCATYGGGGGGSN